MECFNGQKENVRFIWNEKLYFLHKSVKCTERKIYIKCSNGMFFLVINGMF